MHDRKGGVVDHKHELDVAEEYKIMQLATVQLSLTNYAAPSHFLHQHERAKQVDTSRNILWVLIKLKRLISVRPSHRRLNLN